MEPYRSAHRATDLPLTEAGEQHARTLADKLKAFTFTKVFTGPLQRTARTCDLTGFSAIADVDSDLVEWNYGEFEGRCTAEIRKGHPD